MSQIATYVFLDLGTTPKDDPPIKITEISMVALDRKDITTLENTLPLLRNKLTICINPDKELPLRFKLNNENLKNETKFDKKVSETMKLFLNCQRKPVCLIAHNGFRFDFPILAEHLEDIGVWPEWRNEDIMCTDSIYAFYDIMENQDPIRRKKENETTPTKKKNKVPLPILQLKRLCFYMINGNDKEPSDSYQLPDISMRVFDNLSREAHISENDCILIAEIFIKYAVECMQWVDENHCLFSETKKLKLPKKTQKQRN